MITKGWKKNILDHGYLKVVDWMGTEENIVEAARMSTGKGFFDWYWQEDTYADAVCTKCFTYHLADTLPWEDVGEAGEEPVCTNCWNTTVRKVKDMQWAQEPKLLGKKGQKRDLSLLETLLSNRHSTPFEMCEVVVEVFAPIMVFREWHRHRTQSYNEFSGRYAQMPNIHYLPEPARIQKQSTANKQGSAESMELDYAKGVVRQLEREQAEVYTNYEGLVRDGVAKEVARLNTPVARYSKMRAKTDLRNWLAFLSLRMDLAAQFEIQQYALGIAEIIHGLYPKTYELFLEYEFLAVRFSRSEMRALRQMMLSLDGHAQKFIDEANLNGNLKMRDRDVKALVSKLTDDKEAKYKHIPGAKRSES